MDWEKLFSDPYKSKIQKILPTLFNMVELENKRGNKLGMEVGTARERVLIALFMYVYGKDNVEFPSSTSPEMDAIVCGCDVSIKTKSTPGDYGIKLVWTVDWHKVQYFVDNYVPCSDLLYVQILWNKQSGFYLFLETSQKEALSKLGRSKFFKAPRLGTNPRGVEISKEAIQFLRQHEHTLSIPIQWNRDKSLLTERALYGRWVDLWDTLS